MTVAEYMKLNGLTDEQMAELLHRDRSVVTKMRLRKTGVSLEIAAQLQRLSGGKITPMDLLPADSPPAEARAS